MEACEHFNIEQVNQKWYWCCESLKGLDTIFCRRYTTFCKVTMLIQSPFETQITLCRLVSFQHACISYSRSPMLVKNLNKRGVIRKNLLIKTWLEWEFPFKSNYSLNFIKSRVSFRSTNTPIPLSVVRPFRESSEPKNNMAPWNPDIICGFMRNW